jgi:DNA-binding CsgD family transcriptional regulator/PAS domain-containing protein
MQIDDLVSAIYDAVIDPARWERALVRVSDALSAIGALHLYYYCREPERSPHLFGRLDPDLTQSYLLRHSQSSLWAKPFRLMAAGQVTSLDAHIPASQLVRTEFYDDILRPQRILHCGAACLARDAERFVSFCVYRAADAGPVEDAELCLLAALAPHINRATQINARLGKTAASEEAKTHALDLVDHGIILVDAQARILFTNRAAASILALRDGLTVARGDLRTASAADGRRLNALIAGTQRGSSGGTMRVARPSLAEPLLLLVAPARAGRPWPVESAPAALVFVTDPAREPRPAAHRLAELFELTATEAAVALALAGGDGVPQTAIALKITKNTVHTHLRSIFRKLGINGQAELVRVLMRAAIIDPAPPDGRDRPGPPPNRVTPGGKIRLAGSQEDARDTKETLGSFLLTRRARSAQ